jgi:phytoene synthase
MTGLAAKVRAGDRDRWVTAMMAGPLAPRLMAIYAFDLELARIPVLVSEPLIGEMRLQFWRDAIAAIYEGGAVPGHEVAAPLAEAIAAASLPRGPFEALLDARRMDLSGEPHADRAAFDRYIAGAHSGVMALAARAIGGGDATDAIAADLGHASGVAKLLSAAPARIAEGRSPLPLAEGETHEVAADALLRLDRARARRREAPQSAAPAFFAAWRAGGVLRRAARPAADPAAGFASSEFAARAALAFRAVLGRW